MSRDTYITDEACGERWRLMLGDSCERLALCVLVKRQHRSVRHSFGVDAYPVGKAAGR